MSQMAIWAGIVAASETIPAQIARTRPALSGVGEGESFSPALIVAIL